MKIKTFCQALPESVVINVLKETGFNYKTCASGSVALLKLKCPELMEMPLLVAYPRSEGIVEIVLK